MTEIIQNKHILSNYLVLGLIKIKNGTRIKLKGVEKRKIVNNGTNNAIEVLQLHRYVIQVDR